MHLPQNIWCSHHCFLPLPFLDGCASVCSFPVTSDRSTAKSNNEDSNQLNTLVKRAPKQVGTTQICILWYQQQAPAIWSCHAVTGVFPKPKRTYSATLLPALHSHPLNQWPESLACFSGALPLRLNNMDVSDVLFIERHWALYDNQTFCFSQYLTAYIPQKEKETKKAITAVDASTSDAYFACALKITKTLMNMPKDKSNIILLSFLFAWMF